MKALMISATQSNCGKTSFTLGLVYALKRRGIKVQTFKCGPDYLDPTYLSLASGRTCYNLDLWMGGSEYLKNIFTEACAGRLNDEQEVEIAIVEGAMGLYDGIGVEGIPSSAADIALELDIPVVLLSSAKSMAGSFAAVAYGFTKFPGAPEICSVVANFVGSPRHHKIIADSFKNIPAMPKLAGAVMRDAFPALPSRHLGLVTASENILDSDILDSLADAVESAVDVKMLLDSAQEINATGKQCERNKISARLGIALDDAFHFYYPDNLDALRSVGVELIEFSPLNDTYLPDDLDGLYIGGGYPECFGDTLSANKSMLASICEFSATGRLIYAECGGLMYLAQCLTDTNKKQYDMCGLIPISVRLLEKFKTLGYVEAVAQSDSIWSVGAVVRGHEYHYSEVVEQLPQGWKHAYESRFARDLSATAYAEGYVCNNIHASYLHVHFAASEQLINAFVDKLISCKGD